MNKDFRTLSPLFIVIACLSLGVVLSGSETKDKQPSENEKWKKKDIRDYTEADLERLLDQWDENDSDSDSDEPDDIPPWKREPTKIDFSNLDTKDPEAMLKASKKGKTVMLFVSVSGTPDMSETETISAVWHTGLINGQLDTKRYVTDSGRVMFVVDDGINAWTVKDFLVEQERCGDVTIDGKVYPGKGSKTKANDEL